MVPSRYTLTSCVGSLHSDGLTMVHGLGRMHPWGASLRGGFSRKNERERSGGWYCPAIDNVFGPRNGGGSWRRQKRDQVGYLFRLGRPAERNAAKGIHDDLSTTLV